MTYHAFGSVMLAPTVYAIYWGPGTQSIPADYQSLINRWFGDIGGTSLYNIVTQYYEGNPPTYMQNASTLGGDGEHRAADEHAGTHAHADEHADEDADSDTDEHAPAPLRGARGAAPSGSAAGNRTEGWTVTPSVIAPRACALDGSTVPVVAVVT